MKEEISAGGVIVRKSNSQWEVLLIRDMNHKWTFPKGLQEPNESLIQTAFREIKEEVGLVKLQLLKSLTPITYTYTRHEHITKTVHYYLFEQVAEENPSPQKEEGITEIHWIPMQHALTVIDYPQTNKLILEEANAFLIHLTL